MCVKESEGACVCVCVRERGMEGGWWDTGSAVATCTLFLDCGGWKGYCVISTSVFSECLLSPQMYAFTYIVMYMGSVVCNVHVHM